MSSSSSKGSSLCSGKALPVRIRRPGTLNFSRDNTNSALLWRPGEVYNESVREALLPPLLGCFWYSRDGVDSSVQAREESHAASIFCRLSRRLLGGLIAVLAIWLFRPVGLPGQMMFYLFVVQAVALYAFIDFQAAIGPDAHRRAYR